MANERIEQQVTWLIHLLNSYAVCECDSMLTQHIEVNFPITEHEKIENYLISAIRRGECSANSKPQLERWCIRELKRYAESQLPFRLAQEHSAYSGRLTLSAVKSIAQFVGTRRANTPPFPVARFDGNTALIELDGGILRVPGKQGSDDPRENFVPVLRLLWPFAIRNGRVEKYQSVESRSNGLLVASRIPLHQLFVDFTHGNCANSPIEAKNGDFLDWTNGNLQRTGPNGAIPETRFKQFKQSSDGADLHPLSTTNTLHPLDGSPVSQVPARASKPKGHGSDSDERDDFAGYVRCESF